MNEEEKKAVERMKQVLAKNVHTFINELEIVLNLIEKLQKENEEWDRKFCDLQNLYFKLQDESESKRKEYQETYKDVREELKEWQETYKSEKKMKNEYVKLYQDLLLKENVIPVQKVKDKIEEVQKEYNKLDKQVDEYINDANKDLSKYYENKEKIGTMQTLAWVIDNLQELLEGRK